MYPMYLSAASLSETSAIRGLNITGCFGDNMLDIIGKCVTSADVNLKYGYQKTLCKVISNATVKCRSYTKDQIIQKPNQCL